MLLCNGSIINLEDCGKYHSCSWWNGTCGWTQLSEIAASILSLPPTSAAAERSLSRHAWIHSARRSRLATDIPAELVFISHKFALCNNSMLDRGRKTSETDSTGIVATARLTVGTKINESEDRDVDIESVSEVSIIMSLHDSSDEIDFLYIEDKVCYLNTRVGMYLTALGP